MKKTIRYSLLTVICVFALIGCSSKRTVYAPGFTEAKFVRIKIGMQSADVISILGQPLEKHTYETRKYKITSVSGKIKSATLILDNGRVIDYAESAYSMGIRGGMRLQKAENVLGTQVSHRSDFECVWQYSRIPYLEGEVREIVFDEGGRVIRIEKSFTRD